MALLVVVIGFCICVKKTRECSLLLLHVDIVVTKAAFASLVDEGVCLLEDDLIPVRV